MPEIHLILCRRLYAHADILSSIRYRPYGGIVQGRIQRGVIFIGADSHGRERLEVVADIELALRTVVAARPYFRVGHSPVGPHVPYHGLRIGNKPVVVIAAEGDAVIREVRVDPVAEAPVVDAVDCPVGSAEACRHHYHVALYHRRQGRTLHLGLEIHTYGSVGGGVYLRLEGLYFVYRTQVVLHAAHHFVELLHGAALGHSGRNRKAGPLRLAVEVRPLHSLVEQRKTRPEHIVYDLAVVGIGFPRDIFGKQAGRDAERGDEQQRKHPAVRKRPAQVGGIAGIPADDAAQPAHIGRPGSVVTDGNIVQQGRDEQIRHEQRHAQVDDYRKRELHEARPFRLGQQEYRKQRGHRSEHRAQQGREHAAVVVPRVVVHHDYGVVDYDSERHRHSGEGVDMYLQADYPVQADGYQYVDGEGYRDEQHIAPRTVGDEREHEQQEQAEQGADIYLVQFRPDVFGGVVVHRDRNLLRERRLQAGYHRLDLVNHRQQVRVRTHTDRERQRVESVDAEITRWQRLLIAHGGYVAEPDYPSAYVLHGSHAHVALRKAGEPHGIAAAARGDHAEHLLAVTGGEG